MGAGGERREERGEIENANQILQVLKTHAWHFSVYVIGAVFSFSDLLIFVLTAIYMHTWTQLLF